MKISFSASSHFLPRQRTTRSAEQPARECSPPNRPKSKRVKIWSMCFTLWWFLHYIFFLNKLNFYFTSCRNKTHLILNSYPTDSFHFPPFICPHLSLSLSVLPVKLTTNKSKFSFRKKLTFLLNRLLDLSSLWRSKSSL